MAIFDTHYLPLSGWSLTAAYQRLNLHVARAKWLPEHLRGVIFIKQMWVCEFDFFFFSGLGLGARQRPPTKREKQLVGRGEGRGGVRGLSELHSNHVLGAQSYQCNIPALADASRWLWSELLPFPLCAEPFRLLTLYWNLIGRKGPSLFCPFDPLRCGRDTACSGWREEFEGKTRYHPGLQRIP